MANVNITPGAGDIVAAEDISSVKYQQIKLIDSTASSTTGIGITANPLVVGGNIASASTDSGKPIKIGGVYNSSSPTFTNGQRGDLQLDVNGNNKTTLATLIAGEDLTANKLVVEQRNSYSLVAIDTQIKGAAGFLHSITFAPNDAVPTAGSIIVYDSLTEANTQIFNWNVAATAFIPFTVIIDASFSTGLYIGFTTTADVNVTVSWR